MSNKTTLDQLTMPAGIVPDSIDKEEEQEQRIGKWLPFASINFSDKSIQVFHVDTRDFYVLRSTKVLEQLDLAKTRKYPNNYFHTNEEIVTLLTRLFEESGGAKDRKWLALKGVYRTENQNLKYIHIVRVKDKLAVCNRHFFIFNKGDLSKPVELLPDKYRVK